MLRLSVVFFVLSVVTAFFAYGDIEAGAATIAQSVFFVCVAVFVVTIFAMPVRKAKP